MGATWAEPVGAGHVGALFAPGSTFCSGCQEPQLCDQEGPPWVTPSLLAIF